MLLLVVLNLLLLVVLLLVLLLLVLLLLVLLLTVVLLLVALYKYLGIKKLKKTPPEEREVRSVKRSAQRDRRRVAELCYLEIAAPVIGHGLIKGIGGSAPGSPLVATVASAENLDGGMTLGARKSNGVFLPGTTLDDGAMVVKDAISFGAIGQGRGCGEDGSGSDESCFDHRKGCEGTL